MSALPSVLAALGCIGLAGFLLRWALGPQPELTEEELDEGDPYRDAGSW